VRCSRMSATFYHTVCLELQLYYVFLGEPCMKCVQGDMVRNGIWNDDDIELIKKSYTGANFLVEIPKHGL
jgi:hypothetical protein